MQTYRFSVVENGKTVEDVEQQVMSFEKALLETRRTAVGFFGDGFATEARSVTVTLSDHEGKQLAVYELVGRRTLFT